MSQEDYLTLATREFQRLKKLADDAIAQISAEHFFAAPGEEDNSIAVIVKHMAGNMRSRWERFLTTDGEKPDRNRDSEFELTPADTRDELLAAWDRAWAILFAELKPLRPQDLERSVKIRGEPLSVLQAINRQLTHYAYHVGQIVYVAKHWGGSKWKSLSIPRGASARFNQNPEKYIR
jgi:uncharacterized damage-inducible protein DinB